MLLKYITTVYDKPSSLTHKVIGLLGGRDKKKAMSRSCSSLADKEVVQFYEWANLLVLLLNRIPFLRKYAGAIKKRTIDDFGIKVAKYAIKAGADIVVMYDGMALAGFKYLKQHSPKTICVLDTSTVSHDFMIDTFDRMIEKLNDDTIKSEYPYLWFSGAREKYNEEIGIADYFLVPSEIVKESLLYQGKVQEDKILKIPYGVNVEKFNVSTLKKDNKPRKLLFVGQVTCRKGINILLKTLNEFDENQIELYVAGGFSRESSWYAEYGNKKNVHFLGFVTRDIIADLYASVDAFVLPSYAEGLALVGLEAMSSGLPIICSQYSGVNDLIENGVNGLLVDIFEDGSLRKAIQTVIDSNSETLRKMGLAARKTAENYTWVHYNDKVQSLFAKMCHTQCLTK